MRYRAMVDLPGVPTNDDKFKRLIREFLEAKEKEFEKDDWKAKLSDGFVTVLTGSKDNRPIYKVKEEVDLTKIPVIVGEFPGKEGNELLAYITEEYGKNLPSACLRRLEIDAFGRNGEDLHDWEGKLPDIEAKLLADIHGLSRQREIHLLQGVVCQETNVNLNDDIRLIHPEPDEIYARSQLREAKGIPPLTNADSLLEIETTKRRDDRSVKEQSSRQLRTALAALRLYGGSPVDTVQTHQIPVTYVPSGTESPIRGPTIPPATYSVSPADAQQLKNLFKLLGEFYDEKQGFRPPIDIAIMHFEASLSRRTNHHSSTTFGVIGLESLYKHYTDGGGSSRAIQQHVAFTLGQAVPHLDPLTVKSHLEDAYNHRSGWVHGETIPDEDSKTQQRIWDYLRYSIIVFANLCDSTDDNSELTVEEALLDEEKRNAFADKLSEISVDKYLRTRTV